MSQTVTQVYKVVISCDVPRCPNTVEQEFAHRPGQQQNVLPEGWVACTGYFTDGEWSRAKYVKGPADLCHDHASWQGP